MRSIINDIHGMLELPVQPRDEQREKITAQLDPMMEQIVDEFGLAFSQRLTDLYIDLCDGDDLREFRLGFITGAKLMMEVLG